MLNDLQTRIGYTFNDQELLLEALTHSTYANEHRSESLLDNQRLEFLGDTIVNAAITRKVFLAFPGCDEGRLTKIRAELVREDMLVRIARNLNLGQELRLGKGEEHDSGREKPSILADAYEALIGAVFLDSSFELACDVVDRHVDAAAGVLADLRLSDFKSLLIEHCQARFRTVPELLVAEETGPEHGKTFVVEVWINGEIMGRGEGRSKKQASQKACREALKSLNYPLL